MKMQDTKESLLYLRPKKRPLLFFFFLLFVIVIGFIIFYPISKSYQYKGVVTCEQDRCALRIRLPITQAIVALDYGEKLKFQDEVSPLQLHAISLAYDDLYLEQYQNLGIEVPKKDYEENRLYSFQIILKKESYFQKIWKNIF